MTEKNKIRDKAKRIHDYIWSNKDEKYLKFAEEQAKQFAQESNATSPIRRDIIEDQILTDILNDNTYDYKSYVNDSYGSPEYMTTKNGSHFTDKYKTVWHPTFSNESQYSNNISDYNPNGIEGGYWEDNTYRLSKDQEDNNWNIQRTKDYLDKAETKPIKLLSNSGMPIYISNPKGEGGYYYNPFKDGSDIHIKPSHRGRLTALKQRTGKSEAELYRTGGPEIRKMITFARNARKWKHDEGSNMFLTGGESGAIVNQNRNKVYNNYEQAVDNNMGPFMTSLRKGLRYAKDYISDSVPAGISNCTLTATQWVDPNNPIMSAKTIVSNPGSVGYSKINANQVVPGDLLIAKMPGKSSYHTMYVSGFDNNGQPLLDYSRGGINVENNLRTNIPLNWYTSNSDGHTQNLYFRNNKFAKSVLPEIIIIGKNKKKSDGGNIFDGEKSSQIPLIADRDFYIDNNGRFYYDNDKGTLLPSKETVMYYNPSYKEEDSTDWLKNYYVDRDSLTRVPKGSKYYQQSDGAIRFEPTIEVNDTKGMKISAKDKPLELVSPEFTALTAGRALANGAIDAMTEPVYNWTLRNPTTTKLIGAGIEAPMYSELIQRRLIDGNNSGGFVQNLMDATVGLGALSRIPTIANNAYDITKQGLNWANRNYVQPYRLSRAIDQSKFVPDYYDALYNENVLRNSVDNNFNYLFHSRRKDIGNYLPIITKSKSKELGFYGKNDIKNKIWWKYGYPFYEETNAIPTVAVPVKGKSNFTVQKVNNHFDPNVYISDEVSLSDDAIRLTNVPFQNRWVPQNNFIYDSKLSKPKVTTEPEVSTIDFNTARTAQEQPNLLGYVSTEGRNFDLVKDWSKEVEDLSKMTTEQRMEYFRQNPDYAIQLSDVNFMNDNNAYNFDVWADARKVANNTDYSIFRGGSNVIDTFKKMQQLQYQDYITGRLKNNIFNNYSFTIPELGQEKLQQVPEWVQRELNNSTISRMAEMRGSKGPLVDNLNKEINRIYKEGYTEYPESAYKKAGQEQFSGFYSPENDFVSIREGHTDFALPHEERHKLDYTVPLTEEEENILASAYDQNFINLGNNNELWEGKTIYMDPERVTTNRDARAELLGVTHSERTPINLQNKIIDKMPDSKIFEAVEISNGYGRKFINYLRQHNLLTPEKAQQFREAMKKVGVVLPTEILTGVGLSAVSNQ